jgi:hypothetical protein
VGIQVGPVPVAERMQHKKNVVNGLDVLAKSADTLHEQAENGFKGGAEFDAVRTPRAEGSYGEGP